MPQISHIHYHDILQARRFDADFFKPEYLLMDQKLVNYGCFDFISLIDILTDGKHGGVTFVNDGVLFLRNTNIVNGSINIAERLYISEEESNESKRAEITSGDLLLTTIGTIGECAVVPNEIKKANINQNLVKIRLKSGYSPTIISIFLNSKFGKYQTNRMASGNVQSLLNYPKIKQIKIPILPESFQLQIESLVKEAHSKQTQSKSLYHQAEQLLLAELGLLDHQIIHRLSFTTTKSAVATATRYDAEYFQPKYEEIIAKIEQYHGGWDIIGNQFKMINGKTPTEYFDDEDEVQVLKTKQIRSESIDYEKVVYTKKDMVSSLLKHKDVVFASMGVGSLGRTGIFYDFETSKKTGVDGTLKVLRKMGTLEPETLLVFLNSIIGQEYVYRYIVGSTGIISIKNELIKEIKIPLIAPATQTRIADLITQSHTLRRESKQLLENAKKMVEDEIEKV